ncbi:hypothetical protein [Streptomyces youssoufiensis]
MQSMDPGQEGDVPCRNPKCPNLIPSQSSSGRPRLYCRDACGSAYRRAQPKTKVADSHAYAIQVAEESARAFDEVLQPTREGNPLEALRRITRARLRDDDLIAALVQQARHQGVKGEEIAKAMNITPDTLSRTFSVAACERRRSRRTGT